MSPTDVLVEVAPREPAFAGVLEGKVVFLTGATGGVGKVILHQLLRYTPVAKVLCLVRPAADGTSAEQRLHDEVLAGEALQSLRKAWEGELGSRLLARVEAIEGDVASPHFGLEPSRWEALAGRVDLVINCAGLVDFQGPIDTELAINTHGPRHALALARLASEKFRRPVPLCHVSTCFVSGTQDGFIEEAQEVATYPRQAELGWAFDPEREVQELEDLVRRIRAEGHSQSATARAAASLRSEVNDGRPISERRLRRHLELAVTKRLVDEGAQRAAVWGWPNTYTFTKALGERLLLASHGQVPLTIVRPSIVSVAVRDPQPGWTDAKNTIAPLAYLAWRGQRLFPIDRDHVLDLIPVDYVANATIAVAAESLRGRASGIYQLCSGDSNPLRGGRLIELLELGLRRERLARHAAGWAGKLQATLGPVAVSGEVFDRYSTPRWATLLDGAAGAVGRLPKDGAGRLGRLIDGWLASRPALKALEPHLPALAARLEGGEALSPLLRRLDRGRDNLETLLENQRRQLGLVQSVVQSYRPFTHDIRPIFSARRTHALYQQLSPVEWRALPFAPHSLGWRNYWLDLQLEGLYRHSFPALGEELRPADPELTGETLVELLERVSRRHASKVALQRTGTGGVERISFAELARQARLLGAGLQKAGVRPGDRVALLAESAPQWVCAWFAVLEAGAVVVPLDARSSRDQAESLLRASEARLLLVSEAQSERLAPAGAVASAPWPCRAVGLERFVAGEPLQALPASAGGDPADARLTPAAPAERVATILYTSGTTNAPKGVMLTHDNLLFLVTNLASVYDLGPKDATLSVLPLHHAFELCAGMLFPLSRGATVNYLEELTSETLRNTLASANITVMTAVPALLELFDAGIEAKLRALGPKAPEIFGAMASVLKALRDRTGLNLGKLFFAPVHAAFGSSFRFFVSGGAALSPALFERFRGLGLDIFEGYGMTEASPVITTCRPSGPQIAGSVGPPVPGVEVRIDNPDEQGVGEVLARGRNVMAGYFRQPQLTSEVMDEGWLRTGDLGRLDQAGNLAIAGRKKEVIVDRAGNTVYPDELEELYAGSPFVSELAIVGVDGGAQVGCVVVPAYASHSALSRAEVDRQVHRHLQSAGAALPPYKRVTKLLLLEGALPRTATRKVKRLALQQLFLAQAADAAPDSPATTSQPASSRPSSSAAETLVLQVLRDVAGVSAQATAADPSLALALLGVDSVALVEVIAALEHALGTHIQFSLDGLVTVGDLVAALGADAPAESPPDAYQAPAPLPATTPELPALVKSAGRALTRFGRGAALRTVFSLEVSGGGFIPWHIPSIIVANHCSHLDAPVLLEALGAYTKDAAVLAAADYFFAGPLRAFFFSNFTELIPIDRSAPGPESLRRAGEALSRGRSVVVFPEGGRSPDGQLKPFRAGIGSLALDNGRGILPVLIRGTHAALPKGAILPRPGHFQVRIGSPLSIDLLRHETQGLPRLQAFRQVAARAEAAVRALDVQQRPAKPLPAGNLPQPSPPPPAPPSRLQVVAHAELGSTRERSVQS